MLFKRLIISGLFILLASTNGESLVNYYSEWKYFEGRTEPSIPQTAWKQLNFDDSDWKSGPSGFSVGFGSYNAPTKLQGMPGEYSSVYLRKVFDIDDIDWIKSLILRVDYDDGFVAYINGKEVVRRGLEGETNKHVPFNSLAALHQRGNPELIDITQFKPLLKNGENLLAIQAHNHQLNDNWFAYYVELLANVVRGPFIQSTTTTSTKIAWNTHSPSTSIVEYGLTQALGLQTENNTPKTKHVLRIDNLEPNQTYYYRVGGKTANEQMFSQSSSFKTMKSSGAVKLMLLGDTGRGNLIQNKISSLLRREKPDAVMIAGDMVYPDFRPNYEDFRHFSIYKKQMKSVPFFTTIGNHDLYQGDTHYINAFHLPTNNLPSLGLKHPEVPYRFSGTEHFYSFDVGDAHISVLFSPWYNHHNFSKDTNQLHWLTNDLAQTTKPWKLLLMHFPVASSSGHGWSSYDGNALPDTIDFGNTIYPIVSKYNVDLMMAGHSHAFEKFNPVAGCISVVSGAGGASPYSFYRFFPGALQYWPKNNAARISIKGEKLKLEALDTNGEVFDWFVINRQLPNQDIWSSYWHSPTIENYIPNDNHGNINGQEFDLIGTPIPCIIGESSNLGQIRVNNDSTHLYIGFEQAMIRPHQNIFLFIDSLKESGVSTLKGLGDGLIQTAPNSEGVDGLDFLQNLVFKNFNPSVAAILGDENCDKQSRDFARPGLKINIPEGPPKNNTSSLVPFPLGQGAFLLNQKFSNLPGIRFQQFNRSPQQFSQPEETDANFIELAIPFSSLQNIQPGEEIRIGAVVGTGGINTHPELQFRQLDSTYLGKSFESNENGLYELEGIKVKLAKNPDPDFDDLTTYREIELGTDPDNADTDGDNLPDGWEVARGFNPLVHEGEKALGFDPDDDEMNNRDELAAGTDPLDANSKLKLEARTTTNGVRLSWIAQPNIRYHLATSDQVEGPYIILGQEHSHNKTHPSEIKITLKWPDQPNNKPEAYFRIQVSP